MITIPSPDWMKDALCRRIGMPDDWYPGDGSNGRHAKRHSESVALICDVCPVRESCLEHALENRETYGIWGGKTPEQRKAMTPKRPGGRRREPIRHGTPGGYKTHLRRGEDACEDCLKAVALAVAESKAKRATTKTKDTA